MRRYYWRCIKAAFKGKLGLASAISGLITCVLGGIAYFVPTLEGTVKMLLWAIPTCVFVGTIILGLMLSPYLVNKEDEEGLARLRDKNAELEKKLKEKEKKDFSLVWLGVDEFWLRDSQGGRSLYDITIEDGMVSLLLIGSISVNTLRQIQVESVELDMGRQRIPSNWESDSFYQPLSVGVEFEMPLDIGRGERTARLRAIVDGDEYFTDSFTIELPHKPKG